ERRRLPTAWDAAVELRTRIGRWDARVDLYHKELSAVPTSPPSTDPLSEFLVLSPDSIRLGEGRIDGLELSVAGRLRAFSLAAAYRWQRERRTLEGRTFVPRTDRRHRVVLSATRPIWGERELALSTTWMSGVPVTEVEAVLPGIDEIGADGRAAHGRPVGRLLFGAPNAG